MFTQINKIDFLKILLGAGKESIILTFRPGQAHHTYDHIYFFDKNEKSFFSIYVVRKEQITPENIILGKEYFFNEKTNKFNEYNKNTGINMDFVFDCFFPIQLNQDLLKISEQIIEAFCQKKIGKNKYQDFLIALKEKKMIEGVIDKNQGQISKI